MRKVLIITYYWPPSGGSGVQRWLKFSKYLPKNGWKPIIYTPENPSFEIKDEDLIKDIHPDTEIWKSTIWEPYTLKNKLFGENKTANAGIIQNKYSIKNRILNWIRGNLFIPDPKIFWVKKSIKLLDDRIKKNKITHIVSTGPPHSMHLISMGLKKRNSELKWIADFRDPWSELDLLDEFHLSKNSIEKHRKLEKKVLETADMTLTVSETWVKSFSLLGSNNVKLITNGFDEDDFNLREKENDRFVIGHFGLLNHLRNPKHLWRVLNSLCKENSSFNDKLEIKLSGNIDQEVIQSITQFSFLKDKVSFLGYLSHKEVIREYNNTSVLLLLLFNSQSGIGNYPGKMFEYFAARKPILAFGPKESDCNQLILKTKTGFYYDYDDSYNLRDNLLDIFENRKELTPSDTINNFNREKLAKDLSNLLNSI